MSNEEFWSHLCWTLLCMSLSFFVGLKVGWDMRKREDTR